MSPSDFKSRDSISVDLILDHYEAMGISRGMPIASAIKIAREMRVGLYEMGALAAAFNARKLNSLRPDSVFMDRCVKEGRFPPAIALHFLMFENSIKLMRGAKPKLLLPVHLLDKGDSYD